MPHVELSLTDRPGTPRSRIERQGTSSLQRWARTAAAASEPSLVLDAHMTIQAVSASCAELLGLGDSKAALGKRLRDTMDPLVDFTASRARLDEAEAEKIPPLLAITSGRIARGLIRTVDPATDATTTLDAVATPLTDGSTVVGSISFFARI